MDYFLISLMLFICTLFGWDSKVQRPAYFIIAILFSLVFAFRPKLTPDTPEYIYIFQSVNINDGWFSGFERYEAGYCFLNRVVKSITNRHELLFFLISIINYSAFYYVLNKNIRETKKENSNVKFSYYFVPILAFYTSYYGLLYNSIALRAGIALSLMFVSFSLFYSKKFIYGLVPLVLAIFFHQTALLALPLVLLFYFRLSTNRKNALLILIFSFLIYITNIRVFTSSVIPYIADMLYSRFPDVTIFWWISHYTEGDMSKVGGISLYMLLCFVLGYILLCNSKKDKIDTYTFVYVIGLFIHSLFGNYSLMVRFTEYFLFSVCIAFGTVFTLQQNIKIGLSTRAIVINRSVLLIIISLFYYLIFLRNSVQIL